MAAVGAWTVDDWGRDAHARRRRVARSATCAGDAIVGGAERLPGAAGALIVVNARRYALAPFFTALALTQATGRPVRFVGRPDIAPVGAFARRLGGLLARPDEVAAPCAAGELLVIGRPSRAASAARRSDRPPPDRRGGGRPGRRVFPAADGELAVQPRTPGSRSDAVAVPPSGAVARSPSSS